MNNKAISEEKQKELLLGVLEKIAERCRKQGYTFWLYWGTLLGVVRHKGMIPWDDDIDIAMPRKDYEAFREDVLKNPLSDNIVFVDRDHPVSSFYPNSFGKVGRRDTVIKYPDYGNEYETIVSIDVFPMDGIPEDKEERLALADRIDDLTDKINRCVFIPNRQGRSAVRYALALLRRNLRLTFLYKKWLKEKNSIIDGFRKYDGSEYCGFPSNINVRGRRLVFRREWFETIQMEFEGGMWPVPKGFDEILEIVFPDYMELPPVEERVSHHDYSSVEWR